MAEWHSGQKRHKRTILLDDIKMEGVHLHAQRTLDRVRARMVKRLADLRIECAQLPRLPARERFIEKVRARRAYGLIS